MVLCHHRPIINKKNALNYAETSDERYVTSGKPDTDAQSRFWSAQQNSSQICVIVLYAYYEHFSCNECEQ